MIVPNTVLVTGSHTRGTYAFVERVLNMEHRIQPFERLVAGGADFIDTLAAQWAQAHKVSYAVEFAQWKYGLQAGPQRNERMLKLYRPYLILAFNGDTGTHDMMARAREAGIKVQEYNE